MKCVYMNYKKYPLAILLTALVTLNAVSCSNNDSLSLLNPSSARLQDPLSEQFYNVMAGELYGEMGNDKLSLEHYLRVAMQNDDPSVAKRATQIASRSGQNSKAIKVARRWLKLAPKSLEARQYLALLLMRQKEHQKSAQQLHKAQIQLDKQGKEGVEIIAIMLASEKQHESVYQTYKEYQKLEPISANIQLILSSLAFKARHYEEALAAVQPLSTQLKGESKEQALLLQSKILYKLERQSEAMQILSPLMQSKSTTDVALLEYVRLLIRDNRNEDAATVLLRLNAKYPNSLDISKALIALYLDLQEYTQAEKHLPKLLKSIKYQGVAHHFQAEIYESRHELDSALNEYQKVQDGELYDSAQGRIPQLLAQQHGLDMAREWLHQKVSNTKITKIKAKFLIIEATMLLDKSEFKEAVNLLNEADSLTPNHIDIRYSRAIALQELNQIAQAELDFRFVLSKNKNDVNTLNALGYMLANKTNRLDEAQELINKALSLRPDDTMIIDSLGWLYYKQGKMDKAETHLKEAYKANNDPEIASHLIEVLSKKGNKEEALAIFKEMIEQFPNDDQLKRVKKNIIDYNRNS
ncbi:MAG TPA: tetratricopeptide repeat protein [Leucothrix mucor]|uniref:Tetratricopeptide repeat protein n=1 Tax=Leucothrix mucor TaxID=45248 RepID=A0A7V2SZX7_LEUMU|nr:tetratricopeptide repeat protein [Leucothrix mucor]